VNVEFGFRVDFGDFAFLQKGEGHGVAPMLG
jgi:hypothetical protein